MIPGCEACGLENVTVHHTGAHWAEYVDGVCQHVCEVCHEELSRDTEKTAKIAHDPVTAPAVPATYTACGFTEGEKCSVCGEILTASEEIPAPGHDYVDGVCTRCGDILHTDGWVQDENGIWYYFKSSGAMAANEWCGGYWLNANGSWTYQPKGSWHKDSTGWWFGDTSGWYAKNSMVKIDNVYYTFNAPGYWVK